MPRSARHFIKEIRKIKIIPKILTRKEKSAVSVLSILALLSLAVLGIQFVNSRTVFLPKNGGTYIEGMAGSPKLINPLFASANEIDNDLAHLLFNGLFKNKNGEIVPDLATGYTVSDDKLTYTIKLRTDVLFHDRVPLTADDVVFTVQTAQNEAVGSSLYGSIRGVKIKKIDDATVEFTLQQQFAPFPSVLTFGIIPKHIWETIPVEAMRLADGNIKTPIGTGPFKIKRFKRDNLGVIKSYTLARNEEYFIHAPYLNEITIKFYADIETAIEGLRNKNVDGLRYAPAGYQQKIAGKKVKIESISLPQYAAVFFNTTRNTRLASYDVRAALAQAINKTELVKTALAGGGLAIDSPILPGFLGFHPNIKKYPYDPKEAENRIASAGWKKITREEYIKNNPELSGAAQQFFWEKGDDTLSVTLTTVDSPETETVAAFVKKQWEQVGVIVVLDIVSKKELGGSVIGPRNYDALLIGNNVGADPDPYAFWHSSQIESPGGVNLALYKNQKADAILEEARKLADRGERAKKYVAFQDILAEDIPAIFLYNPTYQYPISTDLKGFSAGAISVQADRFNYAEEWYVKTKRKFVLGNE
ncbi:MAG: peptide ABC transporter substrate-binding protein [Candidatus Jacksonbacteria bacterium]|nr:peptide ABC transporter substrate-binding protein [Candidatus Jacksonbacteria bacterium]